jgi:hypothetical protein
MIPTDKARQLALERSRLREERRIKGEQYAAKLKAERETREEWDSQLRIAKERRERK